MLTQGIGNVGALAAQAAQEAAGRAQNRPPDLTEPTGIPTIPELIEQAHRNHEAVCHLRQELETLLGDLNGVTSGGDKQLEPGLSQPPAPLGQVQAVNTTVLAKLNDCGHITNAIRDLLFKNHK